MIVWTLEKCNIFDIFRHHEDWNKSGERVEVKEKVVKVLVSRSGTSGGESSRVFPSIHPSSNVLGSHPLFLKLCLEHIFQVEYTKCVAYNMVSQYTTIFTIYTGLTELVKAHNI